MSEIEFSRPPRVVGLGIVVIEGDKRTEPQPTVDVEVRVPVGMTAAELRGGPSDAHRLAALFLDLDELAFADERLAEVLRRYRIEIYRGSVAIYRGSAST